MTDVDQEAPSLPHDWPLPGITLENLYQSALVITDPQHDFFEGGALPVKGSLGIIPIINDWIMAFRSLGYVIAVPLDWHPPRTSHFQEYGGPWPPHCLAGSHGAMPHADLDLPAVDDPAVEALTNEGLFAYFPKGYNVRDDGYSGFDGKTIVAEMGEVSLEEYLRLQGVTLLIFMGLATDYCIRMGVLDALRRGFTVVVPVDCIGAVNLTKNAGDHAISEMAAAGALFLKRNAEGAYEMWNPEAVTEEDPDAAIPEMAILPGDDISPEESEGLPATENEDA